MQLILAYRIIRPCMHLMSNHLSFNFINTCKYLIVITIINSRNCYITKRNCQITCYYRKHQYHNYISDITNIAQKYRCSYWKIRGGVQNYKRKYENDNDIFRTTIMFCYNMKKKYHRFLYI